MTFNEIFTSFISGTPIKRESWGGYWRYVNGRVEIHQKNGENIDFQDTTDIIFTLSHVTQNDWEVATAENVDVPI